MAFSFVFHIQAARLRDPIKLFFPPLIELSLNDYTFFFNVATSPCWEFLIRNQTAVLLVVAPRSDGISLFE
jgi:hypothetical protein